MNSLYVNNNNVIKADGVGWDGWLNRYDPGIQNVQNTSDNNVRLAVRYTES